MKISVAMCTYNGEKFIEKQLDSILDQTMKVDEIIICDDCSKDNTINIVKKYKEKAEIKIKIISNKNNLGVTKNFMNAFKNCTGEIIFLCDQDDIWDKDKVKIIVDKFNENSQINMIGTDALLIDKDDNSMDKKLWDFVGYKWSKDNLTNNYKFQLKKAILTGATAAARKSFIDKFMIESKYVIHDYWLSECASMTDSLYMMNVCLTNYRQHSNNVIGVKKKNKFKFIFRRFFKIKYYYSSYKTFYNQYLELYDYLNDNNVEYSKNNEYLKDCVYFWKIRSNLSHYKFKELLNYLKKFKNDNFYSRYSGRKQDIMFVLDIYYYIVLKIFKFK